MTRSKSFFFLFIFVATFGLLCFSSCNKTEFQAPIALGYSYYPLKTNAVIIYDVDSTVYSDFNNSITEYHFQIKDSVASAFVDLQNDKNFRIDRYKKTDGNWFFQKTLSRKVANNRAEEFIDNRRYVRMVFPQKLDLTWNGNLYNDLDEWRCRFTEINKKQIYNHIQLDSTLTIEQNNDVNLIREDVYFESYAKHIGLVEKRVKAVDKDINNGRIKRGFDYVIKLNSYR